MDHMAQSFDPARRALLAVMAGGAGLAGAGCPSPGLAARGDPAPPVRHHPDEVAWINVRRGFPLKPGLVHLNSANLGAASEAVLDAERAMLKDVNRDPSFENRAKFEASAEAARRTLANLLRADPDEIAMTRNTSEGNRTVIAGLNLGPGDEVVIWSQNHESNSQSWDVWAARYGFKVVRVETPDDPHDPKDLMEAFLAAFTKRTRLVAFSHVANLTGVALPAEALCRAATERGVLTLVDGAQTFGMKDLDLHALGCDFFTGSGHKWLAGPQETGVLYVRRARIEALWPSMVTHNWETWSKAGARKFECLGQRQDGRIAALGLAATRQLELGRDRVEVRIRHLVWALRAGLREALPTARFLTPAPPEFSAGILTFLIDAPDARRVMRTFYDDFNVSALAIPYAGRTLVRFSPNIYNSLADVEVAVKATLQAART
jgi:isopenicillin-N epimerase